MKAKLLKRIRENWDIRIQKERLYPNYIAVSRDKTERYEYCWAYRCDFLELTLRLSGINRILQEFIYYKHQKRVIQRLTKRLKKHSKIRR